MLNLDTLSSQYIDLILALSLHDSECIDFYYGLKKAKTLKLEEIKTKTNKLSQELKQYQSANEKTYQSHYL